MYICKPSKAKTASEKMVKIITSLRFFTDSISAPTMVLRPAPRCQKGQKNGRKRKIDEKKSLVLRLIDKPFCMHGLGEKKWVKDKQSETRRLILSVQ